MSPHRIHAHTFTIFILRIPLFVNYKLISYLISDKDTRNMFYKPISHLHVNLQLPKELLVFLARKRKQRIEKTKGKFAYGFRPSNLQHQCYSKIVWMRNKSHLLLVLSPSKYCFQHKTHTSIYEISYEGGTVWGNCIGTGIYINARHSIWVISMFYRKQMGSFQVSYSQQTTFHNLV